MRVWDVAVFLTAIATVVWYGWFLSRGNTQRSDEDAARIYFDRHGYWPDEAPAPSEHPSGSGPAATSGDDPRA